MKSLLCILACLFLVACGSEGQQSKSDEAATTEASTTEASTTEASTTEASTTEAAADQVNDQVAVQDMVVELATRNVSCGCALEDVGHCGNYIEIESHYVEIANGKELGLGKMEWCKKEGVQVEAAGEVKDGKFVAASLVVK